MEHKVQRFYTTDSIIPCLAHKKHTHKFKSASIGKFVLLLCYCKKVVGSHPLSLKDAVNGWNSVSFRTEVYYKYGIWNALKTRYAVDSIM
jgi:hypothetical protein